MCTSSRSATGRAEPGVVTAACDPNNVFGSDHGVALPLGQTSSATHPLGDLVAHLAPRAQRSRSGCPYRPPAPASERGAARQANGFTKREIRLDKAPPAHPVLPPTPDRSAVGKSDGANRDPLARTHAGSAISKPEVADNRSISGRRQVTHDPALAAPRKKTGAPRGRSRNLSKCRLAPVSLDREPRSSPARARRIRGRGRPPGSRRSPGRARRARGH